MVFSQLFLIWRHENAIRSICFCKMSLYSTTVDHNIIIIIQQHCDDTVLCSQGGKVTGRLTDSSFIITLFCFSDDVSESLTFKITDKRYKMQTHWISFRYHGCFINAEGTILTWSWSCCQSSHSSSASAGDCVWKWLHFTYTLIVWLKSDFGGEQRWNYNDCNLFYHYYLVIADSCMWASVRLHKLRKELQLKHGRHRRAPVTKNDTPDDDDEDSDGEMVWGSCLLQSMVGLMFRFKLRRTQDVSE